MSVQEQRPDGSWGPSAPIPLWVGWRLRIAECGCGERFKGHRWWVLGKATAAELYREHWHREHAS